MKNRYIAINASAGSGKTYSLVKEILLLCLSQPKHEETIRHILALTFTNKAANEMKERLLQWLKEFVSSDYEKCAKLQNLQQDLSNQGNKISLQDLHFRSKNLLNYILHHYSNLNIGTIDKFNSKLLKAFSYELGLPQNFNLEIKPEPYLIEAIEQILSKVGKEEILSRTFMDYVNYFLDNEKKIKIKEEIYTKVKNFIQDTNYQYLLQNKNFGWEAYNKVKEQLRNKKSFLQKQNIEIAKQSLKLIKSKGLENEDFAYGGKRTIQYFFEKYIDNQSITLYETKEKEDFKVEEYKKGSSAKKGKNKEVFIFEIMDNLLENREKIIANYIESVKIEKIQEAILPLKIHQEIREEMYKIEEKNDTVILSKFNTIIYENLKNEPSAFIYEKIGTHFHHYFFDEFQDTSFMQWENFLPLREHILSGENPKGSFTLVGDPKQSIYRFRGGDSELMLNIIHGKENSIHKATVQTLKYNYRSAKNIVEFNNLLYQYISNLDFVKEEHKKLFGEDAFQEAKSVMDGRVRINLIEHSVKEDFYKLTADKMQKDIQKCIDNGFSLSDITILCRDNKDISNFSNILSHLKIIYLGKEIFIKVVSENGLTLNISSTINAVIQFLNWEINPENKKYLVLFFYYLQQSGKILLEDFTLEIKKLLSVKNKKELSLILKNQYGIDIFPENIPKFNLYNYIGYFIQEFSVENQETDFIISFLEILYLFSQNAGMSIKDFLNFWEERGKKETIQSSENIDAINIMTVHKSKGLEFPIVFIPMVNNHGDNKFTDWFRVSQYKNLHSVNISTFKDELSVYDEEISRFNKKNQYRNFIDRICLQYVATTRAVEQLYLYLQKPDDKKNSRIELYDFVQKRNFENNEEFDFFEKGNFREENKIQKQKKKRKDTFVISLNQIKNKKNKILIATPSKRYETTNEKIKQGIFIHEILSKIHTKKDIHRVLQEYFLEGLMDKDEQKAIQSKILQIMEHEIYKKYFEEDIMILNERDVFLLTNGQYSVYRPDRIIETSEGFIIIDFKTGVKNKQHTIQLENYKIALERAGKNIIKTDIIYV